MRWKYAIANDGKRKFFCQFHNEDGLERTGFPLAGASKFDLDAKGMWKKSFDLPPGTRAVPMGMVVMLDQAVHESDSTTAGILVLKVTGIRVKPRWPLGHAHPARHRRYVLQGEAQRQGGAGGGRTTGQNRPAAAR